MTTALPHLGAGQLRWLAQRVLGFSAARETFRQLLIRRRDLVAALEDEQRYEPRRIDVAKPLELWGADLTLVWLLGVIPMSFERSNRRVEAELRPAPKFGPKSPLLTARRGPMGRPTKASQRGLGGPPPAHRPELGGGGEIPLRLAARSIGCHPATTPCPVAFGP